MKRRLAERLALRAWPVAFWLAAAAAPACTTDIEVTAGKDFPYQRALAIQKHIFTSTDVRNLLGEPLEIQQLEGRRSRWRYFCRKESTDKVLLLFHTRKEVLEQQVLITLDGTLVEDVQLKSHGQTL